MNKQQTIWFALCCCLLVFFAILPCYSEKIIDLGVRGECIELSNEQINVIAKRTGKFEKEMAAIVKEGMEEVKDKREIKLPGFHTKLKKHTGSQKRIIKKLKDELLLERTQGIFFFTCKDESSINAARVWQNKINAAICIDYNTIEEAYAFWAEIGLKCPMQVAQNDSTTEMFGITSYPALLIMRKGEIEIIEGI